MLGRGSLGGGYLLSHFRSTIGVVRLNFSVRNGKRWNPHAITTFVSFQTPNQWRCDGVNPSTGTRTQTDCAATGADAARFRRLLTIDSHERTRAVSRQRCFAFVCLLATANGFPRRRGSRQESLRVISTARLNVSPRVHLPPIYVVVCNDPHGDLILWLASRLDAFSAYPYPTRLPGSAPGGTTGTPEVGPTRSSRTSVRATQISRAHNR